MSPDATARTPPAAPTPSPHRDATEQTRRVRLIDLVLSGALKVAVTTPSAAPRR
jgi:hypothetical protein